MIAIHFSFTTKIPGDTLLSKMPAELYSTEQIFTETSRLAPLYIARHEQGINAGNSAYNVQN